jgi:hypothetical protein
MPPVVTQAPAPRVPAPDSDAALRREEEVRRLAMQRGGSASNIVSDLAASDVTGVRPVLNHVKAVYLGQ